MTRILVMLSILISSYAYSNEATERLNPIELGSPRSTMRTFMVAMDNYLKFKKINPKRAESSLKRASRTLDLSQVSPAFKVDTETSAPVYLKEVIDRVTVINYKKLPGDDSLDSWTLNGTAITIYKVKEGPKKDKYLFSPSTVQNVKEYFTTVEDLPYVVKINQGADYEKPWIESKIPPYMKVKLMGFQRWKYLGVLFYIVFAFFLKYFIEFIIGKIHAFTDASKMVWDDSILEAVSRPALWFIEGVYFYTGARILNFQGQWQSIFSSFIIAYIGVTVVWAVYNLVDIWVDYLGTLSKKRNYGVDAQLLPVIRKSLRFFVVAFGVLITLQNIGFNVMSVVAGLGLGGLAFALAAKDTAANLFGSIMIFSDRPFRVGDWVSFGGQEGIVEDIGLRSTRIRSFTNSLITIPNATVANESIDNLGLRHYRRLKIELGVTYSTSRKQIEEFVAGIKEIFSKHPDTKKDDFHVAFNSFGDSSLNILLYLFLKVPNFGEELRVREELFLEIMKLAESLDISFAFPSRSIYIETENEKI